MLFTFSTGVGFVYDGQIVPNNSYIDVSKVNESRGALHCVTNKVNCCAESQHTGTMSNHGLLTTSWYYPNGTAVDSSGIVYQTKNTAVISLLRRNYYQISTTAFGIYRCSILDRHNVNHNFYIGIYSSAEGMIKLN